MKVLQDIWILEKSGIVVFHRDFNESVAPQLFGAMMSALNMFSEELSDGGLSNFELKNRRFTLIKKKNLLFVSNSSRKFNQKKVNKELKKVSKKFLKLYSEKLENYKGEVGAFSEFENVIKNALEDKT